jgi:hypothetical protein
MNVIRKSLTLLGSISLLALLLAALAPRAARGVAAALVQVTNTTSNPVPTISADNPAKHPFQSSCIGQSSSGDASCTFGVPAGQELVIQGGTIRAFLNPAAGQLVQGTIAPSANGRSEFHFFGLQDIGINFGLSGSPHEYVGTLPYTVYADPESQVSISVFLGNPSQSVSFDATITGYLVTVP